MNRIAYTGWLAGQAAEGLTAFWPVTFILALLAGGAVLNDFWGSRLKLERRLIYLFLPAISFVMILLVGSFFEQRPRLHYFPYIGFGAGVVLAVISAVVLKRAWMSSIAISLCFLWYSLWCGFVSIMSITGDWL